MSDLNEPQTLMHLIDSLKQASSCCRMLATMQQRPAFLMYSEQLDMFVELLPKLAARSPTPRADVLQQLEQRRKRRIAK